VSICEFHQTSAIDFVPTPSSTGLGTDVVLIDGQGYPSQCSLPRAGGELNCSTTSASAIAKSVQSLDLAMQSAVLLTFPHAKGSTQCGSSNKFSMKCSSVREIHEGDDKFVTGSFSAPNKQELLIFKGGRSELCDLTRTPFNCHSLTGVPSSIKVGRVAAAKVMKDKRHALVIVEDKSVTTCTVGENTATLSCSEREASASLRTARFFVVPSQRTGGSEKIQFIPDHSFKKMGSAFSVADAETKTTIVDDQLFNLGTEIVAQANSYFVKPIVDGDSNAQKAITYAKVFNPDSDDDEYEMFPFFSRYTTDEGDMFETWSDSWNRYSWDWDALLAPMPRERCLQECDSALSADTTTCGMIAGAIAGAGLSVTVGATIGALITGPGAVAVAGTGLAVTADITAVSAGLCMGWAYYQRYRCARRC
jgi:hypothetical protein